VAAGKGSPRLRSGQALRLRGWLASRTSHFAQDDRVALLQIYLHVQVVGYEGPGVGGLVYQLCD
jgi:hypothetical protein